MSNLNIRKIVMAGVAGTLAMTVFRMLGPIVNIPKMDMGMMLGVKNPMMAMPYWMGWMMHFVIGIILTFIYAAFLMDKLPSDGWKQGAIYSILPWLLMSLALAPMMGMGLFGGTIMAGVGGLLGHLAYGSAMGYVMGRSDG
ncbi:MAG: hypothetical protein IIB43_09620 [Candidatus Marinimicrobia bacterium]|nr:hypothetical protein [Candidatus Neomarinimicrobiota bacterium]